MRIKKTSLKLIYYCTFENYKIAILTPSNCRYFTMKKLLLFFTLCFVINSQGQERSFSIDWEASQQLRAETYSIEVPSFQKEHFSFTYTEGLQFIAEWKIDHFINKGSAVLKNVQYATVNESELKGLRDAFIPSSEKFIITNATDRNQNYAHLRISPIIKENGVYKKILKFTISYSSSTSSANRNTSNVQNVYSSVLSQGTWHKFYVEESGVYRLSKSFLNSLGVNTSVDPRTIKIYGMGGAMIPLNNDVPYPEDLVENAIQFVGEQDGVFDSGDYILFYAEGPTNEDVIRADNNSNFNVTSNTNNNLFTDRTYYFVNVSSSFGKRMLPLSQPLQAANETITTFHEYQFYEMDEFNLAQLGRRWFGDRFDFENEKTFEFEFPNAIVGQDAQINIHAAAAGEVATSMQVNVNGQSVADFSFDEINDPILGDDDFFSGVIPSSQNFTVNLVYNNGGNPSSFGFLDYIAIEAESALNANGGQFKFRNNNVAQLSGVGEYQITNAAQVDQVWEITDKANVRYLPNNQGASFNFKANLGELKTYVVVKDSDYFEPRRDGSASVANQDLKGTIFLNDQGVFQDIDYLIVSSNEMLAQAERLASINKTQYNLNIKVVTLDKIYNEFSTGNQDIGAIRNFVRYIYNNASAPENRLKYLCLFGDASYDYKNRIPNNTNIVPSWYSYNSFSLSGSFVSDDFFGMMDAGEGTMVPSDKLDVAVGRILADSPQRAKELVDKIASYYVAEAQGNWRNNAIMIADDVDVSWETILQDTSDEIGDDIVANKPFMNVQKVFSDAFIQESSAGGDRYPRVNRVIFDGVEVGALVVNYFGHGGEDGLASERIWDKINVQEVDNDCRLHLFVTVTCEYTKFDNPNRETAGEFIYWNKKGGAVALITTTRQIFVSVGVAFNVVLEDYLFALSAEDQVSMAEALRLAKNDPAIASNPQKPLVFYIGDPAMKLAFAKPDIQLTQINDQPIENGTEVLEALGRIKMKGQVNDGQGNILNNYNGVLTATVFDKNIQRSTLGNDGTTDSGQLIIKDFETQGEKIFNGQATVTNGEFEFEFVVPRDIGIPVGQGKVSFYAKTSDLSQDKAGFSFDIQVGGLDENAEEDTEGPNINLFMNDENFVSGGITNEGPTLLAKLFDTNGINTASGIGHDIIAILDGDETQPFKLNDYYLADVDDFQRGTVTYPFRDLEPGLHTLTLKAWDVYNNSSTTEIQFVVFDEDDELVVENVLNYPNPFINYTEFWFNHNSSDVLDVSIQIFTVSGKLVKTINGQTSGGSKNTSSLSRDIAWDGRDDFGDKIGKGVYVYKLIVQSTQRNRRVEKIQKLVIL